MADVDDESPTDASNTLAAAATVPPVALKLVEVQLMIKGMAGADAATIA